MNSFIAAFLFVLLIMISPPTQAQTDSLDSYIARLKSSKSNGGSETAFMSIGSDFLYALEYFETSNYSSAASGLEGIVRRDKMHPYANYLLAVSLLKQNDPQKASQAQKHLSAAILALPSLKTRYNKEFPNASNMAASSPALMQKQEANPGAKAGLDEYIKRIKHSRNTGGSETAMLTPGLDAFYGIEYYEIGDFRSAETNFGLSLSKDPANAYINYMHAIALAAQGKSKEAQLYLAKAAAADKTLLQRFEKEASLAAAKWKGRQQLTTVKTAPASETDYGGKLKLGKYTCHVSVWNGPNVSPAYRNDYKGYFELRKDGTYRWLDDGATGRYQYDVTSGKITWLSGYFKGYQPQSSLYQTGNESAQITVRFSDSLRWNCGCQTN